MHASPTFIRTKFLYGFLVRFSKKTGAIDTFEKTKKAAQSEMNRSINVPYSNLKYFDKIKTPQRYTRFKIEN
jgi:hypothetical protein